MTAMAAADGGTAVSHPLLSRRYRGWVVAVLLLVSVLNFADRAILSVLAQPIKEDLQLTDTDLGILQGLGFAIFYSVLGVPLGLLAERVNRTRLIAVCVAIWSAMTVACGFATGFVTLLAGRVGVGIGEAGVQPPTSSLLSDHFESSRRASALAVILLGAPLGFLVGQSVGGVLASEWGWRAAFYAMGVPGLLVALLVIGTLREPPRGLVEGTTEATAGKAPALGEVLRYLWAKASFRQLLAGVTISGFAMNAVANFVLPFYLRGFGVPIATLGMIFGVVSLTSNGLGMLLGGFGFDRLSRRDPRWALWGPALVTVLCMPAYFGAFTAGEVRLSLAYVWFGNFFLAMFMASSAATMQNLAGPRMRATTSALVALVGGLFAAGLGPTALGMASDFFAERLFAGGGFAASCPGGRGADGIGTALDLACQAVSAQGLRYALIGVLGFFLWGALHYLLAARTLRQDLYTGD